MSGWRKTEGHLDFARCERIWGHMRIGIVAPSTPILPDDAEAVRALASLGYPDVELEFDPQCFATHGHFAGEDGHRFAALVEMANRPDIDAVWFARGGYGACRIAEDAVAAMTGAARGKAFLGYSDQGNLLGALYRDGFDHVAHGPMVADIRREGGDAGRRIRTGLRARNVRHFRQAFRPFSRRHRRPWLHQTPIQTRTRS